LDLGVGLNVNGDQADRRIVIRRIVIHVLQHDPLYAASCMSHSATTRDSLAQNSIMATVVLGGYSLGHC
jgi:hypothetical protein